MATQDRMKTQLKMAFTVEPKTSGIIFNRSDTGTTAKETITNGYKSSTVNKLFSRHLNKCGSLSKNKDNKKKNK